MNVGEVFSLPVTKDERCFFVVTEMHKGSEDSKVAVPYGPTGSHLNISASVSVHNMEQHHQSTAHM